MTGEFDEVSANPAELKRQGGPEVEAHVHCANHRTELDRSSVAGCFYCCTSFAAAGIEDWVDDGGTALCPNCGIDSVIGDASGFRVSDEAFLKRMHSIWF
ncbi:MULTISPECIES: cytoplasmic protein [unclassified Sphingobium]|uniref:cytoplasmic protein n=1 Tax=unclassified Sphingobium TaxID=2611147 RepID=UPI0022257B92|nr:MULTISPECIES: cytoplasmic protein [unclassified Sphingobium]MCW2349070.1 hypothetical protein [Sphingobium sp. B12D2B]MCW2368199.1 hypothetical protein [Sphingobium sp. B11D3D]MCW2396485.1 hypothetical protein [Sphingobium sp. B8D3B]MCW2420001.1 hypothetical protein [Sphingobium sp. B8D3C]